MLNLYTQKTRFKHLLCFCQTALTRYKRVFLSAFCLHLVTWEATVLLVDIVCNWGVSSFSTTILSMWIVRVTLAEKQLPIVHEIRTKLVSYMPRVLYRKRTSMLTGLKVSFLARKCVFYRPGYNANGGTHRYAFWSLWNVQMK